MKPKLRLHPKTGRPIRPLGTLPNGRVVWPIMGASPDDPDAGDGDGDQGGDDPKRQFTQEEVNRMMTSEKRQGRNAGVREVLESLGFKDADEATAYLTRVREQERQHETEQQRKDRELAEREAAQQRDDALLKAERRTLSLERALIRRNVGQDDLEDALALLDRQVGADADADAIAEAADALKERRAELFGSTGDQQQQPAPRGGGDPGGRPRNRNTPPPSTFGAGGLAEAKRRGWIKD